MLLTDLYHDPTKQTGFSGAKKIKVAVGHKRTPKVSKWLRAQLTYTLHKSMPTKLPRRKTLINGTGVQVQLDLTEVQKLSGENDRVKYLLTAVDVFSVTGTCLPTENKDWMGGVKGYRLFVGRNAIWSCADRQGQGVALL